MNKKKKLFLILALLLVSVICGWRMINEPLWGYLPLFLFISIWAVIILATEKFILISRARFRFLALSTLTGLILYLGFPTLPFTPLMFIGFIPLLIITYELETIKVKRPNLVLFYYAFHSFMVWNILSTFWVANTALIPSIFAFIPNSLLMTGAWLLFNLIRKPIANNYQVLALIGSWISFEYVHLQWEISWPWLTLGNAFAQYPSWVQWYEVTGVFGGTAWILLLNFLLFKAYTLIRSARKDAITISWMALFIIIAPIVVSLIRYVTYEEDGEMKKVLVVQPNYEPHYEKFQLSSNTQYDGIRNLIESNIDSTLDYIILPETIFSGVDFDDPGRNKYVNGLVSLLASYPETKLVTGLSTQRVFTDEIPEDAVVRTYLGAKDTVYWEAHNSAFQFQLNEEPQSYVKGKLVPGAESFPFKKLLFFIKPIIDKLGGSMGLGTSTERIVFSSKDDHIAPAICYESIYGEYVGEYMKKGAEAIFVMTNDGWWDDTPGHIQHMKFASLRAIEHRTPVIRSANTGISCTIDQKGRISNKTVYGETTVIKAEVLFKNSQTIYTKNGDILANIAMLLFIMLFANWGLKSVMTRVGA